MKLKDTKSRPKSPSYGKFQRKGIKVVGKWKQVKIDPNMFASGQMDDLVCFEELTDYRLVSPAKNPSSLFSKAEPKKRKAHAVPEGEEEGECSSAKKKMKLKKSKDVETEGTSAQTECEVKEAEPEPQGDGAVRPEPEGGEMAPGGLALTVPKKKKKKEKRKSEPSQGATPQVPKKSKTWLPEVRDQKADVSAWKDLFVPRPVLRALSALGFSAPTPIQALTLAPAIRDKLDILGAAETGSGKTLAFAIPMIHSVLQWQVKKPTPALSNTAAPPGETGAEAGSPSKAGTESGSMCVEMGIEGEALPSETGAAISDQVLPFWDDDAGEGPSSLIREKSIPKQDEDKEEKLDEQTGTLQQEFDVKSVTCKSHPKRPLLGLVLPLQTEEEEAKAQNKRAAAAGAPAKYKCKLTALRQPAVTTHGPCSLVMRDTSTFPFTPLSAGYRNLSPTPPRSGRDLMQIVLF
uniref:ATP-dependent RNA helicase n=1 Tax=Myotis myotis TaxID=51298 RepID=A0A7J8AJS1_MYOMY|nr:DEAD-box helicase 24 [Myotis myotis]